MKKYNWWKDSYGIQKGFKADEEKMKQEIQWRKMGCFKENVYWRCHYEAMSFLHNRKCLILLKM